MQFLVQFAASYQAIIPTYIRVCIKDQTSGCRHEHTVFFRPSRGSFDTIACGAALRRLKPTHCHHLFTSPVSISYYPVRVPPSYRKFLIIVISVSLIETDVIRPSSIRTSSVFLTTSARRGRIPVIRTSSAMPAQTPIYYGL